MMNTAKAIFILLLLPAIFLCGSCNNKNDNINGMANRIARKSLADQYPKIPSQEILRETNGNSLFSELKNRYSQNLSALKNEVEHDKAKLVVIVISPEVGKFANPGNTYGIPYIIEACTNLGIDCIDFTPDISEWMEADSKRVPIEGNFTIEGTSFVADLLTSIVEKYDSFHSPKRFTGTKPEVFGDLNSKEDEVLDGEKNIPYRLTVNAQGLRMNHNISFPKQKQTILFLGDSKIFNPFVDNEYMTTEILQRKYPDREIVNAGNLNYTMEDYYTLYVEKARFVEPDIVVVCTNGGDILDNYFSQRNKYSRSAKAYKPSDPEVKFYKEITK